MKTILVTSDLTYAPRNYYDVLETVLEKSQEHITAVIIIKINLYNPLGKVPYLYFAGCKNIANTLAHNLGDILLKRKEKLFDRVNVPYIYAGSVNDPKIISWIQRMEPDIMLNIRARCIYNDAVLKVPRLGCINVHHGILPQQRGLFCDLFALADNRETGFTIHEMTNQVDQGKIFYQEKIKWNKDYVEYLTNVSSKEMAAIANFINQTAQNNFLPKGTLATCDKPMVTTTPDFKTIKQLQHNGIIL